MEMDAADFFEYAVQKAKEFNVDDLCEFFLDDINEAVKTEKDYDCVVFGAAGVDVGLSSFNLTSPTARSSVPASIHQQ